jgi:2-polyprenyl-6-methoxyphenol hydroxylase-like FAD-dependent oxidoreductase
LVDRGDAANHGIEDAANLAAALKRVLDGEMELQDAVAEFEEELRLRCQPAVRASRQACLDAHDWQRIGEGSPLVERGRGSEKRMGPDGRMIG